MGMYCGIHWPEGHHDVAVVNDTGRLLATRQISDDPAGLAVLLQVLADCGDSREEPGASRDRDRPRAAGRDAARARPGLRHQIHSRHPGTRVRQTASGRKSDRGDVMAAGDTYCHRPGRAPAAASRQPAELAAGRLAGAGPERVAGVGFRTWQSPGCQVRIGERGIVISRALHLPAGGGDEGTGRPAASVAGGGSGAPLIARVGGSPRVRRPYMFDQTDGQRLPGRRTGAAHRARPHGLRDRLADPGLRARLHPLERGGCAGVKRL